MQRRQGKEVDVFVKAISYRIKEIDKIFFWLSDGFEEKNVSFLFLSKNDLEIGKRKKAIRSKLNDADECIRDIERLFRRIKQFGSGFSKTDEIFLYRKTAGFKAEFAEIEKQQSSFKESFNKTFGE